MEGGTAERLMWELKVVKVLSLKVSHSLSHGNVVKKFSFFFFCLSFFVFVILQNTTCVGKKKKTAFFFCFVLFTSDRPTCGL